MNFKLRTAPEDKCKISYPICQEEKMEMAGTRWTPDGKRKRGRPKETW